MSTLLDVERAHITRASNGAVTIDDPDSPLLVTVQTGQYRGRTRIVDLRIQARHPSARISSAVLHRLPIAHILHVAAATKPGSHPNEAYYRTLAQPKPQGQRGWDDEHWMRVFRVYEWARTTGRPGGPIQAIADLWGVSVNPTAYRWMTELRRRYPATLEAANASNASAASVSS